MTENYKTLKVESKDPGILKEMKSKVNRKKLIQALSLAGSGLDKHRFANKGAMEGIINDWAIAKYEYYLLFGREITISKDFQYAFDIKEVEQAIYHLKLKFPKHIPTLERLHNSSFTSDILFGDSLFEDLIPDLYTKGSSCIDFIDKYLQDDALTESLEKIRDTQLVNGQISLSIDPLDYLTLNIPKVGLYSIEIQNYFPRSAGTMAMMVDQSTVIAFRDNKSTVSYSDYGFKFEHNSKTFQREIFIDKLNASFLIKEGRLSGPSSETTFNSIIDFLQNTISSFLKTEEPWIIPLPQLEYIAGSPFIRHTYLMESPYLPVTYFSACLQSNQFKPNYFEVGADIRCVYCGNTIEENPNDCELSRLSSSDVCELSRLPSPSACAVCINCL